MKLDLAQIGKNQRVELIAFQTDEPETEIRLREIGFAEGDVLEITHIGLFGGSPLNVRLHGTSIALRPKEAKIMQVRAITAEQ